MNENEQIQEMAWDICEVPKHPTMTNCKECGGQHCHATYYAELAYRKGYRKVERGEWVKPTPLSKEYCSKCRLTPKMLLGLLPDFCPNCGADMRGEK